MPRRASRLLAVGIIAGLASLGTVATGAAPVVVMPNDTGAYWSPDGRFLAFNREAPLSNPHLGGTWIVPADRGPAVWINDGLVRAWHPSGDRLLVVDGETTEIVTTGGTTVARINGLFATWSRDGRQLAFLRGHDLLVAESTGANERVVATDIPVRPGWDLAGPAWSPDGTELVLSVHSGEGLNPFVDSSLIVFRSDGSGSRLLYRGPNQNTNPVWSPDGSRIAFESNAGDWHVLTIPAAGGVAATLGEGRLPEWSPAGDRISFISQRARVLGGVYAYRFDLYVMDADGGRVRERANDVHPNFPPQWSPSGAQLSYSAGRECLRWGVYVQSSSGGDEMQRTNRCLLIGTNGRDRLVGTDYTDIIRGLGGGDTILARGGADTIDGGGGNDRVFAGRNPDLVDGGPGNDLLVTGRGNDEVTGGPGVDTIAAGLGRDTIDTRDGFRDVVDCGGGFEPDTAVVDRRDVVRNCERVESR